ncbi:MAG: hypothetical protein Q8R30_04690 [bacterium]|nr:hypothetical protein [bacterium]
MSRHRSWRRLIVPVCALFVLTACATTKYVENPTAPPPDSALKAATDHLELAVRYIIVPDGQGSWVKGAKWDEWVLTFKTHADLGLEQISVVDSRGVHIDAEPYSIHRLETLSDAVAKEYQRFGINIASGQALGTLLSVVGYFPGIGTVVQAFSFLSMGSGMASRHLDMKDKETIQAEFTKRRLALPMDLSSGADVTGSAFFPFTHQPKEIIVRYHTPQDQNQLLRLPLPATNATQK